VQHRRSQGGFAMESKQSGPKYTTTSWGWGRTVGPVAEVLAWKAFPWRVSYALSAAVPLLLLRTIGVGVSWGSFVAFVALAALLFLPITVAMLVIHSRLSVVDTPLDQSCITFKDKALEQAWRGRKPAIEEVQEAYFAQKLDMPDDLLPALYNRHSWSVPILTVEHIKVRYAAAAAAPRAPNRLPVLRRTLGDFFA
jgi:hypothetical protein